MDTLFVHRSVLARTYKLSIIPIEHPLMTLVFCWSWLMVMLQVRIYVYLVLRLVSAALDLAPYWVTNASWSLSSLTRIDDDYSGGINLATCYKYEWSIYSRQKLCSIASEILYWWSQLGPQVKQNWSHLLIIHGAKTIQYDLGNCNDSNFESSSAVGLWLGRQ